MMQRKGTTPATLDLFADDAPQPPATDRIGPQSFVFRGFVLPFIDRLLPALEAVLSRAPFRNMVTPGGFTMSVALSSCGQFGWRPTAAVTSTRVSIRRQARTGRTCPKSS